MSEMIERVARALYSDDPEQWDDALRIASGEWGGGSIRNDPSTMARYQEDLDDARAKARAVIEVMREPTEEMTLAPPDVNFSPGDALHAWQAMIDAALADG